MTAEERQKKEKALMELLEFSLLFPLPIKTKIIENLGKFSDEQVLAFGKILAIEHYRRGELDEAMRKTLQEQLTKLNLNS